MDICIDFDGTCVKHAFPEVGEDIGAVPVLRALVDNGHRLILWTMRDDMVTNKTSDDPDITLVTGTFLTDAINWFKEHNIPLYGIQTNPTQKQWTDSPKAYCQLYIDDCGACIPLIKPKGERPYVNWSELSKWLVKEGYICG